MNMSGKNKQISGYERKARQIKNAKRRTGMPPSRLIRVWETMGETNRNTELCGFEQHTKSVFAVIFVAHKNQKL